MEQNKSMLIFSVICNDEDYLNSIIERYNSNYRTDFKIIDIIDDEVRFVKIQVTNYKPSDLFAIGYQFGVKEQMLREQGKIDW